MSPIDQITPGLSGLETLSALIAAGGRLRIGDSLGITRVEGGKGWPAFPSIPSPCAYNPPESAHGGYAAPLLVMEH